MKKPLFLLFVLSVFLMSFQCDDEVEGTIVTNNFKATVSDATISVNDTLWIKGKVSSQAFDEAIGDSIPNNLPNGDVFSLYKLRSTSNEGNSIDAVNDFEIIQETGQFSTINSCPNAGLVIESALSDDSSEYIYRMGFKSLNEGDYVLLWDSGTTITNEDRNTEILTNYPVDGSIKTIEFNRCGIISSLLNIDTSDRLYFFSVE